MSDVTCRGSFALGTACGKCPRCRREVESYNAMKAVRDKLNTPSSALARIEELEAELHLMKTSGIVEVAVRNPSVMEYMRHWEGRAERAEAKLAKAVDALEYIYDGHSAAGRNSQLMANKAEDALAQITGGKADV